MRKKTHKRLDYKILSQAVMDAATSLNERDGEEALVAYFKEIANEKPSSFLSLIVKLAQHVEDKKINKKIKNKKIKIIEIVAPDIKK